jgi:hypothetical protein
MTVIVKYSIDGKPEYRSARGVGSSETERLQAKKLDALLYTRLAELKSDMFKKKILNKGGKGSVESYWELGFVLREIFYESNFIHHTEKSLFWLNANLHIPKELSAKDRSPNRMHIEYCFRLAGFDKNMAIKMNWGEWVYLFDSPGINKENRFDAWFQNKIMSNESKQTRHEIRNLAQIINNLIGKIETKDLNDEQLLRCYDTSWDIKERLNIDESKLSNDKLKNILKQSIKMNYRIFGEVIIGKFSIPEFVSIVLKTIQSENKL